MKASIMVQAIEYHKNNDSRPLRVKDMYLPDGSHYVELMENMGDGWRGIWYRGARVEGFVSREELDKLRKKIMEVEDEKIAPRKKLIAVP